MVNPSNEIEVYKSGSMQYMDSREVAEIVEKEHKNIVRDIKRYSEELAKLNFELSEFFIESSYSVEGQSRKYLCYLVTKKGCEFIAHKLTGIKGTKFTATYINRFHEMEDELSAKPRQLTALEQLQLQSQAILEVNDKVTAIEQRLEVLEQDLPLLAVEQDRVVQAVKMRVVAILGGRQSNACNNYYLSSKTFQTLYKDLYSCFNVRSYKNIKHNQLDVAVDFINQYQPPVYLQKLITDTNTQKGTEA